MEMGWIKAQLRVLLTKKSLINVIMRKGLDDPVVDTLDWILVSLLALSNNNDTNIKLVEQVSGYLDLETEWTTRWAFEAKRSRFESLFEHQYWDTGIYS